MLRKQFELSYFGNAGSYAETDRLPVSELGAFYEMLKEQKNREKEARDRAERDRRSRIRNPRKR